MVEGRVAGVIGHFHTWNSLKLNEKKKNITKRSERSGSETTSSMERNGRVLE